MEKIPKQKKSGLPLLGLGTYNLRGSECENVVQQALEMGYRHIDTADLYENHAEIGKAIKGWPRQDIILVSKLFLKSLTPEKVQATVPRFLQELDVDYLDLLLIHWPSPEVSLSDTLAAMTALKEQGLVRGIGISNFVRRHLQDLAPYHFPIITNQIEMHPYLQRKTLVTMCRKMEIPVTAYRPLAKGAFENDSTLKKIGQKYKKSPSQVALRWLVQQDIAAIPKAANLKHLKDNLNIFDFKLDQEDSKLIDGLDSGIRYCAPEGYPVYDD